MSWEFSCFFPAIFVSALVLCFLCPWQLQLLLLCCASIRRCCGSGSLEDYIRGHHSQRQAIGIDRHVADHRRLHLHGHRLQLLPKVLRFGRRRRSGSKMPWHVHRNSIFNFRRLPMRFMLLIIIFRFRSVLCSTCTKALEQAAVLVMSSSPQMVMIMKFTESFSTSVSFSSSLSFCSPSFRVWNLRLVSFHCACSYSKMTFVTGFIIDAFGALRDQMQGVEDELSNNCFICGIGKDYLDSVPHGFDIHVQKEHNLANYL